MTSIQIEQATPADSAQIEMLYKHLVADPNISVARIKLTDYLLKQDFKS